MELAEGNQIIFLQSDEWFSFNTLELISKRPDHIIEDYVANSILDFRNESIKIRYERELNKYKNLIQKLSDEKILLQKKLGKFTKPEIINKIINKDYSNLTIAIKSPHPEGTTHWGDLFFSIALKKSFEKLGFNVIVQEREHWYDEKDVDIAFV